MRPLIEEYDAYYSRYINFVEGDNIIEILSEQIHDVETLLGSIGEQKASYRYAEGKWSIKEVVGHMLDAERVFSCRALRLARKDKIALSSYDHDMYIKSGKFYKRNLDDLIKEFKLLRQSNLILFDSFDREDLSQKGTVSGRAISVLALLYIAAGHIRHHLSIIKERYLSS